MPQHHAAERVRRRIREWIEAEGHGSRTSLAKAVPAKFGEPKSTSWVTDLLRRSGKKQSDLRLRDLDAVAAAMGVPPGDLVRRDQDLYLEVTPSEIRLLRYFRALPDVIRGHLLTYCDYIFGFHERALSEQAAERDRRTNLAKAELAQQKKRKTPVSA
jgi:hypothetical protein